MAITPTVIKAERREEFGKGSARRLRRDGYLILWLVGPQTLNIVLTAIFSPRPNPAPICPAHTKTPARVRRMAVTAAPETPT